MPRAPNDRNEGHLLQLNVDQLVVDRGERRVLEDVSFALGAGHALTLLGPNGSGKTTLIRTLAGFIAPVSGTIRLDGPNIDPQAPIGESCHYVGHANGTKSSLTVAENLLFWSRYLNTQTPSSPDAALEHFNLFELADIPAAYLSAGQKRRLGLARLLIAKRPIWLLDEPTVSLDAESVKLLADAVAAHVSDGGLVIAATHIPLGLSDAREMHLERLPMQQVQ